MGVSNGQQTVHEPMHHKKYYTKTVNIPDEKKRPTEELHKTNILAVQGFDPKLRTGANANENKPFWRTPEAGACQAHVTQTNCKRWNAKKKNKLQKVSSVSERQM